MNVKKTSLPERSLSHKYLPVDYKDTFQCEIIKDAFINPDDILIDFWTDMPKWINSLFKIRNFLVKYIGLKGSEKRDSEALENCIRRGGVYGFISIPEKKENETIMLMKDKHLDAYMAILINKEESLQRIYVITLVKFNNKLGNLYFFIIRPFHNIIVKSMLKRSIKKII